MTTLDLIKPPAPGLRPHNDRAGGYAIQAGYAARADAQANCPLTFNPDLQAGADHDPPGSAGAGHRPARPASVAAIIGPNGACKPTLLRAVAGLVPARGRVLFGVDDLLALSAGRRAAKLGFMPQTVPNGVGLNLLETVIGAQDRRLLMQRTVERSIDKATHARRWLTAFTKVRKWPRRKSRPMRKRSPGQKRSASDLLICARR